MECSLFVEGFFSQGEYFVCLVFMSGGSKEPAELKAKYLNLMVHIFDGHDLATIRESGKKQLKLVFFY